MGYILGLSAYYHDSAAALIKDGEIIAAVEEERFTRKKHDGSFPENAICYCLQEGNIEIKDLDYIVFYDKPLIHFERILETFVSYAPRGLKLFLKVMPIWLKEKVDLKSTLKKKIQTILYCRTNDLPQILFTEHHQSHAGAAFFPSPFEKAAVLCIDGVGEWTTTSLWLGENNTLLPQWEIHFPHSLGLLYSAFTYYIGFKVNSGEYKLMGLAPYGEPRFVRLILDELIDVKMDGTFRLNMHYFDFPFSFTMTNQRFHKLFGGSPRASESLITQKEMDIAKSIQVVSEEIVLRLAKTAHKELGAENLCLSGGVALNCVANGVLLKKSPFKNIWVQPASSDAGSAIGAALVAHYEYLNSKRKPTLSDSMKGSYLGPSFTRNDFLNCFRKNNAVYKELDDKILLPKVAEFISQGGVVAWFQGRMEFGPRALGNRSILGDPRNEKMQSIMNLKIKFRESFRPFAPAITLESKAEYFDLDTPSPYMQFVVQIQENQCIRSNEVNDSSKLKDLEMLHRRRSNFPAVTHVDYSARVQTVTYESNPRFYQLIKEFEKITGYSMLINTSFNVRGEPIVCTPEEAYQCFMKTNVDYLILENFLLAKIEQPHPIQVSKDFELD